ncbi:branched-chain amino acid ABC transporter permease [Marinomonas pollencensis]|uniref:Amino acid/amide ABC transporter membrane protein 1 (HAAT family) n=1 Tax=Marinomonas pollencensis TaxID=491954 RepID=A0A3E0DJF6_9GAMM|nr:branched-chain amino acid ABC transporter permease [Marinomonas pollencensis]REG81933.1 amino acid/amide ABC transporter membrane protein 1 (HAAT family) [Marinomonas pollencensis]
MTNQIIQAILLGGYYALLACGLSFMFSVMKIINLAHGSLLVLAGYLLWFLAEHYHLSPFVGLLIVTPLMMLIGWALQAFLLEKSARGGELLPILTTFGLAIVIENLLFEHFGANTRSLAPYIGDLSWQSWELFSGVYVGKTSVYILVTAIIILGSLQLFMKKTPLGRQIRATAHDPDTAGIVGINPKKASAIAAALAMGTVAISGLALGVRGVFDAYSGGPQLLFAFEATIIGGVGSLWGTLIGGIILALAQTIGANIHPQGFLLGGHILFIIILLIRLVLAKGGVSHRMKAAFGGAK